MEKAPEPKAAPKAVPPIDAPVAAKPTEAKAAANPPAKASDSDRIDAIISVLKANGMSLSKKLA